MTENLPNPRQATPVVEPLYTAPPTSGYQQFVTQPSPMDRPPVQSPMPVAYQQPIPPAPMPSAKGQQSENIHPELRLISHSPLFYWWPIWAVGYTLAIISYVQGQLIPIAETSIKMHPSNNLGVFFVLTLFIVILISNVVIRGMASAVAIMAMVTTTVLFAYFGWWDDILGWVGEMNIYINQGAYFWFSTLIFVVWLFATFVLDRMSYWLVRPGQMTHEFVLGSSSRSYDTDNMTFEKRRDDVFRHWLLGLGSGDLKIMAFSGGHPEEIHIPNVLFIGSKIQMIQQMISERPTQIEPR